MDSRLRGNDKRGQASATPCPTRRLAVAGPLKEEGEAQIKENAGLFCWVVAVAIAVLLSLQEHRPGTGMALLAVGGQGEAQGERLTPGGNEQGVVIGGEAIAHARRKLLLPFRRVCELRPSGGVKESITAAVG